MHKLEFEEPKELLAQFVQKNLELQGEIKHTTLSGTPGGGRGRFFGGATLS